MEREFFVIAIHGEGDRDTINKLQDHRNQMEATRLTLHKLPIPDHLMIPANEPPDVIILLRDADNNNRIEWSVQTWEEVERWKKVAGYDQTKRHWTHGASVKVKIGG